MRTREAHRDLLECIENVHPLIGSNANPRVFDGNPDPLGLAPCVYTDMPGICKLDGVVKQVVHDSVNTIGIGAGCEGCIEIGGEG